MTTETPPSSVPDRSGWFKSSYSNAGGSCVETRFEGRLTHVRDSKDRRPDSPFIELSQDAWTGFLRALTPKGPQ
ncbi:hypothetical protein GCM10027258_60460 [Amycolatopsis stemonae]